jgi:hypothetical protein
MMARFPFSGTVTGIGSLPMDDVSSAIDSVATHSPEIPFWPQLPRLSDSERVIRQGLGVLEGLIEPRAQSFGYEVHPRRIEAVIARLHSSSGELDSEHAVGFSAFESAIAAGRFRDAVAVKGQIEGPISLASYLFAGNKPFVSDDSLLAAVGSHVRQIARWQIARLQRYGLPVMFFVDEPALCLPQLARRFDAIEQLRSLLATVRSAGAIAGLHCCAHLPFREMHCAEPDILSFDADRGLESFFADPDGRAHLEAGGAVAYGMIPTLTSLDEVQVDLLFARWLTAASTFGDPRELARRAMITSTCGLGLLDESAVEPSFAMARQLGALLRKLAES